MIKPSTKIIKHDPNHLGVSKNNGTPKWIIYFMETPMNKWMIWGGKNPYFWVDTHMAYVDHFFQTGL